MKQLEIPTELSTNCFLSVSSIMFAQSFVPQSVVTRMFPQSKAKQLNRSIQTKQTNNLAFVNFNLTSPDNKQIIKNYFISTIAIKETNNC